MKESKKQKKSIPEVHILGDLQGIKMLVAGVNKKKTLVIFQDGEEGSYYLEVDGEIQMILKDDISELEKEYKLIFFTFFPSRKKTEPPIEEEPAGEEQGKKAKKLKSGTRRTEQKSHKHRNHKY
jgi:hypothetical protein